MKSRGLILLLLVLSVGCYAQGDAGVLESYIDDKSNTIVRYPRDWELDHSQHMWVNFTLFPPQDKDPIYPDNFTLTHQNLTDASMTAEKIGKVNEDLIHLIADHPKVVAKKAVSLNGIDAWMLEYTGELVKNNKPLQVHWKHYYFILDHKLYTLSFICLEPHYKKLGPVADQIVSSFKKINP